MGHKRTRKEYDETRRLKTQNSIIEFLGGHKTWLLSKPFPFEGKLVENIAVKCRTCGFEKLVCWMTLQRGLKCSSCKTIKLHNEVLEAIEKQNATYISGNYVTTLIPSYTVKCERGHITERTPNSIYYYGCPECANNKPINFEEQFLPALKKEGYTYVSGTYQNARTEIEVICPKGHRTTTTWNRWDLGYRCRYCAGQLTEEEFEQRVQSFGYRSLGDNWYYCEKGHYFNMGRQEMISGDYGCSVCSDLKKTTFENCYKDMKELGFELLGLKGNRKDKYLVLRCSKGHVFELGRGSYVDKVKKQNRTCPTCNRIELKKNCLIRIFKYCNKHDFEFVKRENGVTNLKCSKGHDFKLSDHNLLCYDPDCPYCEGMNKPERKIYNWISDEKVDLFNKTLVKTELDFYLEEHNLAVEHNGLYWHSNKIVDKDYHYNKFKACADLGIRLIQIFEDELDLPFTKNLLQNSLKTIKSSKPLVMRLSRVIASKFVKENYPYDFTTFKNLGLVENGKLLSVLSITEDGIKVCGISGALKHFLSHLKGKGIESLKSSLDLRFDNHLEFQGCGFKAISEVVIKKHFENHHVVVFDAGHLVVAIDPLSN